MPELVIELNRTGILVTLITMHNWLRKEFTTDYVGLALLEQWARDVGVEGYSIQLRTTDEQLSDLADELARRLTNLKNSVYCTTK